MFFLDCDADGTFSPPCKTVGGQAPACSTITASSNPSLATLCSGGIFSGELVADSANVKCADLTCGTSSKNKCCAKKNNGKYKFLDANPKGVQSITAGVVVSDSLSFIPAVGDELRIYNQDGKTCGTTGIFTVTASNTQSGYTLDTSVVDVTDTTLCKIGGIDCGDKAYALCGWKWPNYQWSQGEKIFAKDKKNAAAGCEWTGGWTAAGDTLYCYSK